MTGNWLDFLNTVREDEEDDDDEGCNNTEPDD